MAQSEAQKRAKAKYNAKAYDRLELKVLKGNKAVIQGYCKDKNTTVNGLINTLLKERLNADGYHLITKSSETITQTRTTKDEDEPLIMPWEE